MNESELVQRLIELKAQAEAIAQQIAETTDLLLSGRKAGEQITYNGHPVYQVTVSRLFDKNKAAAVLTPEQQQQVSKLVLDSTLARERLEPELYALCQRESAMHLRPVAS